MNINYEIRETKSYGKGTFTLESIKAGTCIWTYKRNKNVFEYNEPQCRAFLAQMPSLISQQQFLDSSFGRGQKLCLIVDDGQYMNHADATDNRCNCKTDLISGNCFAARDIGIGEQLFEDYLSFSHPPFLFDLLKQYNCEPNYYVLPTVPTDSSFSAGCCTFS